MKREDLNAIIVYLLMLAVALVFGFTILKEYAPGSNLGDLFIVYVLGAIISGIVFNSILFELGHVLGAKIGRYEILSVNVLGFCFYKKDGKFKFRFANFEGLTGETKIAPKEGCEKEPNPIPYLLFGTFLFLVEAVIVIVLFVMFNKISNANQASALVRTAYFLLTILIIGTMVLVYQVMPLKLDGINDGYRLVLVSNPKNKEAFNELLRVEKAIEEGNTSVEVKTFETITDFTADLNLNKVYLLLNNNKFDEAEPLIDAIIASKDSISRKTYIRTKAQKIYLIIMTRSLEDAAKFYEDEVPLEERREISQDVSMQSIRAYILMSGLLDKSESEVLLALNKVLKAYKHTSKNRQEVEVKLYNNALKRVIEAHPKWNLNGYLLQEKE